MYRVDDGGHLCPLWHGAYRGEEAAHQQEYHHEEPQYEHGLLHGVVIVGDDEPEPTNDEGQQQGQQVDQGKASGTRDAVGEP